MQEKSDPSTPKTQQRQEAGLWAWDWTVNLGQPDPRETSFTLFLGEKGRISKRAQRNQEEVAVGTRLDPTENLDPLQKAK